MADHSIRIGIDSSEAKAGAKDVTLSLQQIQAAAAKAVGSGKGIAIGIDGSRAQAGAAQIQRSLRDIQREAAATVKSTNEIGTSFGRLSNAASGLRGILAAVGIGAGFKTLVDTIGAFEEQMSAVKAVTQAGVADMARMEKAARDLGASTKFSAAEAAEGMKLLGQAGFDATQIITSMPGVLNLAAAGSLDLAKAAEISSNILSSFGLNTGQMGEVADVLAAAAARANTDVTDLGNGMKYVGPIAAALGVSFQDTSAALAALSNAGIKGEQAGTALRGIFASLSDPTKEAEKDIKSLGLSFADLNPSSNSLTAIIGKLSKAGLDASMAFKLFGQEGAPAILSLTRNTGALDELTSGMRNVAGEAERMAKTMGDNLRGDLKNLASAADEAMLAVGDNGLLGGLRALTQTATGVVRVMAGASKSLGDQEQYYVNLTNAVTGLAYALGTVYVARTLGPMIAATGNAVKSQALLVTSMMATQKAAATLAATQAASTAAEVATAQANVRGAQAQLQMAVAMDKATGSMVAQRAAAAQLAVANATLTAAKGRAAAAEGVHAAAIAATTLRARAAAGAMTLLSGAMAFFGGPVGVAITAVAAGIYLLSQRTSDAERSQESFNKDLDEMRRINAELVGASATRRAELEATRQQLIKNAEAEVANAQAAGAALRQRQEEGKASIADVQVGGVNALGKMLGFGDNVIPMNETQQGIKEADDTLAVMQKRLETMRNEKPIVPTVAPAVGGTGTPAGTGKPGGAGGGTGGRVEATKEIDRQRKALEDLMQRYSDEADSIDWNNARMGESAETIDQLTARYDMMKAAKEAGLETDQRVVDRIEFLAEGYGRARQAARELEDAEKAKNDAMRESEHLTAAVMTPLEAYQQRVARLNDLLQQYKDTNGEVGISQDTFNRSLEQLNASMNGDAQQVFENTRTSAEAYAAEVEHLTQLHQLFIDTNGQMGISLDTYNRALEQAQNRTSQFGGSMMGSQTELQRLATSLPNFATAFDQAAAGGLMHFEDALVDIVTGAKGAREAFADMAKSIAQDLARMAIRMAIIQPIAMALGMPMGGMGFGVRHTGGVVGADSAPMRRIAAFHTGGVVGSETPSMRSLPPISSWTKYHTGGLAGNEVPTILQRGEGVFTKGQMASLAPAGSGGSTNNITVNVQQNPNGSDPGAAERQGRIIAQQIKQAVDERLIAARRPGGINNPTGY